MEIMHTQYKEMFKEIQNRLSLLLKSKGLSLKQKSEIVFLIGYCEGAITQIERQEWGWKK